jgi:transposase
MKPPIFVRSLTDQERSQLRTGLRSREAFTLRRCQIVLASSESQWPSEIAATVGCAVQSVRNAIKAFNERGLASLEERSHQTKTSKLIFTGDRREQLRALLHQSPRQFGKPVSTWSLNLVAEVCFAQGITPHLVSDETIRDALKRLKVNWRRAKDWISSPDPAYARKKRRETD